MQLKQRKRINNRVERFNPGKIDGTNPYTVTFNRPVSNTTALGLDMNQRPVDQLNSQQIDRLEQQFGEGSRGSSGGGSQFGNRLANAGGNIVTSGVQFAGAINESFGDVSSTGELQANAGTTQAQGSGFDYQKQNDINAQKEYNKLSKQNTKNTLGTMAAGAGFGAAVGSIFPGFGTAIGAVGGALIGGVVGLFGGKSRRRKLNRRIFNAQQQINANNNYYQSSAQTDYLQQDYLQQHGNTQDDVIYGARHGKDLKQPIRKK